MRSTILVSTLLSTLTQAAFAAPSVLPTYAAFELQARSNLLVNDAGYNLPPGSSFNSISAAINDDAEVAFTVGVVPDGTSSHPGVWSGSHGAGALVYDGPPDAFINSDAAVNSAGAIAFALSDTASSDGLYVYDPTASSASRVSTAPIFPNSYSVAGINADGIVGYQATFSSGRAYASTGNGSSVFHATDSGLDPGSAYTYLYSPAFNNLRHVVAKVATSPDQTSAIEIRAFAADASSTRILANTGVDPDSPYSRFDNGLAVNNLDVVAVVAVRASDNRRVVLRSDGTTTTEIAAVDPAGTIRDIDFFAPAINDAGVVAFRASDANGQAIYVGDGSGLIRVIGKGDAIDTDLGRAQVGQDNDTDAIFAGRPSINARGDIAFVAAVYPQGDNQTEWGSGVFVAYATADDGIFANGFEG